MNWDLNPLYSLNFRDAYLYTDDIEAVARGEQYQQPVDPQGPVSSITIPTSGTIIYDGSQIAANLTISNSGLSIKDISYSLKMEEWLQPYDLHIKYGDGEVVITDFDHSPLTNLGTATDSYKIHKVDPNSWEAPDYSASQEKILFICTSNTGDATGSAQADHFVVDDGCSGSIYAGDGNDTFFIGGGAMGKVLYGDAGNDTFNADTSNMPNDMNQFHAIGGTGSDTFNIKWVKGHSVVLNISEVSEGDIDTINLIGVASDDFTYDINTNYYNIATQSYGTAIVMTEKVGQYFSSFEEKGTLSIVLANGVNDSTNFIGINFGNTFVAAENLLSASKTQEATLLENAEISFGDSCATAISTEVSSMVDIFHEDNKLKISGNQ